MLCIGSTKGSMGCKRFLYSANSGVLLDKFLIWLKVLISASVSYVCAQTA